MFVAIINVLLSTLLEIDIDIQHHAPKKGLAVRFAENHEPTFQNL